MHWLDNAMCGMDKCFVPLPSNRSSALIQWVDQEDDLTRWKIAGMTSFTVEFQITRKMDRAGGWIDLKDGSAKKIDWTRGWLGGFIELEGIDWLKDWFIRSSELLGDELAEVTCKMGWPKWWIELEDSVPRWMDWRVRRIDYSDWLTGP